MSCYLAFDFGAESGRAVLVTLDGDRVKMEQLHRFPNRPVKMNGTLYWDFPFLLAEVLETLKICSQRSIIPSGIAVDTWGVDFGLLGADDQLLSLPVHYRDKRTAGIHQYAAGVLSIEQIFEQTGYEPWEIGSLYQLLSMKRAKSPLLPLAQTFLNMPDLFNFFLTGVKASEKSIANTSNMMNIAGKWSDKIITAFDLPNFFCPLIEPGTILGPLSEDIASPLGLKAVPVVAVCGHDTSSVVASVPAVGDNWAFLSCGTWSILGRLAHAPAANAQCLKKGFANEYTLGGWFTCSNIIGLWLVQELKRKWDSSSDCWDYERMTAAAAEADFAGVIDVTAPSLMAPADMEKALLDLLSRNNQPVPESRGQLVRCVLQSLALEYAWGLETLTELTGEKTDILYMVGGGVSNKLLCQFTANACRLGVYAGIDQCTSLGNALTQALALGKLESHQQIRDVMRNSFELAEYTPQEPAFWAEKIAAYTKIRRCHNK